MNGKWLINNKDTYATWGVTLLKGGYNTIMSPPRPRKRMEHDYTDSNGIAVDTTSPLSYEAYRYKIKIAIVADSYSDFWTKHNAFFAEISTPTPFALQLNDLGITVNVLYEGAENIDKLVRLKSNKVVSTFELSLFEHNPKSRIYG